MAKPFIWHQVSEEEKCEIEKDTKNLLEEFSKKLKEIKTKETHFALDNGMRKEGEPWKKDQEFQKRIFLNAPLVKTNLIITEKGDWKNQKKD